MNKFIEEQESDAHNITLDAHKVTADTFNQTPNAQRDNANTILTSEKLDKSDALSEMFKKLTINDAGYYASDSTNANDAKGDPTSDPKIVTHSSDGKKINVMDTSSGDLQKKKLSNRTLPIITMTMYPRIDDSIATCSGTPHALTMPTTKELIMDAARKSAWFIWTHRHVIRMGRDVSTPGDMTHVVRFPQASSPVLIGGIGVLPFSGHSGILQVCNKRQSTVSKKLGIPKN